MVATTKIETAGSVPTTVDVKGLFKEEAGKQVLVFTASTPSSRAEEFDRVRKAGAEKEAQKIREHNDRINELIKSGRRANIGMYL